MAWKIPGEPYEVEVEGQKVWLKSLTVKERSQLATDIAANSDTEDAPERLEEFYSRIAAFIDQIEGIEGDPAEVLAVQPVSTVMALYEAILTGSSLSPPEAKNSNSSSDTSSPKGEDKTAPASADPDDASDSAT